MAKAAKKERSAEDVRFFEEQRAAAITKFNRDPDSSKEIYDGVIAALNQRVASAMTQKLLSEREPNADGNAHNAENGGRGGNKSKGKGLGGGKKGKGQGGGNGEGGSPDKSKLACKFKTIIGRCTKGRDCPYSHRDEDTKAYREYLGPDAIARMKKGIEASEAKRKDSTTRSPRLTSSQPFD